MTRRKPCKIQKSFSNMAIITYEDLEKVSPVFKGKGGHFLVDTLFKMVNLDDFTRVYDNISSYAGNEFAQKVLETTGVDYLIAGSEVLGNLPEEGFITIHNHPYGGVDGVIVLDLFGGARKDYKVMVNKILGYMKALNPGIISVTPTGEERTAPTSDSIKGVREAMKHLRDGHPLGLFPSGAVSDLKPKERWIIRDREWQEPIIRLIKKARVPVIPVHFLDHNSMFYYRLGLISWKIRLLRLPTEVIDKGGKTVRLTIGHPVSVEEQSRYTDIAEYGKFLRSLVYDMPVPPPSSFVRRSELVLPNSPAYTVGQPVRL